MRVPVFYGHCQVVHLRTRFPIGVAEIRHVLAQAPGLVLEEDECVTPVTHGTAKDEVFLSRLRQDESDPQGLNFWLVADDSRKGSVITSYSIHYTKLYDCWLDGSPGRVPGLAAAGSAAQTQEWHDPWR